MNQSQRKRSCRPCNCPLTRATTILACLIFTSWLTISLRRRRCRGNTFPNGRLDHGSLEHSGDGGTASSLNGRGRPITRAPS